MTEPLPRVLVVIGTRPEGIKLAPVISAFRKRASEVECKVALTGQHTDLMDQVLSVFEIPTDWDLGIMREGQNLYDVAQGVMDGLRDVVRDYKPEIMLVQGDTASVFFGSLVGFFERVQVGHVEAGLRSHDKWRPYPEEIFRRLTSVSSDVHFAPTGDARANLVREAVPEDRIFLTGNTVVDALLDVAQRDIPVENVILQSALENKRRLVLITAHRRESFGAPMREAFSAIRELAERFPDALFLYPVHPNPQVQRVAREILTGHASIVLTQPLGYFDLIAALRHASFALTDSGGIQEEAPTFGTPVLVMREVTERPEGVRAGIAQLVGTDYDKIVQLGSALLTGSLRTEMAKAANPYGDGQAGKRIADIVVHQLTGAARQTSDWQS
ncbi:MAG TPA: UDP-N-acetylglucosamine 2-epimerase (non-hydrolyzing) [Longimicrobiales bacterium]|nr:UDP-N-acetylglucosamine 2-epimerase (non-hydrolyzing) [Longimicrobiales bacterium]